LFQLAWPDSHFPVISGTKKPCQRCFVLTFVPKIIQSGFSENSVFRRLSQNCENRPLSSLYLSVCQSLRPSTWNNLAPTGRIFMKFNIWLCFENLSSKFNFH